MSASFLIFETIVSDILNKTFNVSLCGDDPILATIVSLKLLEKTSLTNSELVLIKYAAGISSAVSLKLAAYSLRYHLPILGRLHSSSENAHWAKRYLTEVKPVTTSSVDATWRTQTFLQLFLDTGDFNYLLEAKDISSRSASIKAFYKLWNYCLVYRLILQPTYETFGTSLTELLSRAIDNNENSLIVELLEKFGEFLETNNRKMAQILVSYGMRDETAAVKLSNLTGKGGESLRANLAARIYHNCKNYKLAHQMFTKQNRAARKSSIIDPNDTFSDIKLRSLLKAVPDEVDRNLNNHFFLSGFPRSGTTLIDNMFTVRSDTVVYEETDVYTKSFAFAARHGLANFDYQRFYLNYRLAMKENISQKITVDKTPSHTFEAHPMKVLFGHCKHVFMLRHPVDVVWSCFAQNFYVNKAMAPFTDLRMSVDFYCFVMERWMTVWCDDPNVHYVNYENLVANPSETLSALCRFLEIPYDEKMLRPEVAAQQRYASTPSYEKVRQGLKIGVQRTGKNYLFAFSKDELSRLNKWAERLGFSAYF